MGSWFGSLGMILGGIDAELYQDSIPKAKKPAVLLLQNVAARAAQCYQIICFVCGSLSRKAIFFYENRGPKLFRCQGFPTSSPSKVVKAILHRISQQQDWLL